MTGDLDLNLHCHENLKSCIRNLYGEAMVHRIHLHNNPVGNMNFHDCENLTSCAPYGRLQV